MIARNPDRARRSACGPTRATASRSSATSPTTSTTRPRSSPARSTALVDAGEVRHSDVAVFYRTNAQSRVFEEVFIRVGLPYKVVGGVRFYERTRGARRARLPAGAGQPGGHGQPAAHPQHAQARHRRPGRGAASRRYAERRADLVRRGAAAGRRRIPGWRPASVSGDRGVRRDARRAARSWSRAAPSPADDPRGGAGATGYLAELEASEDPQDETGWRTWPSSSRSRGSSRARRGRRLRATPEVDGRRARPGSLAAFLEQVSLVADADSIPDATTRRRGHPDDPAHREGPGVPGGVPHRLGGRGVPAHARARRPRSWPRSAGWRTSASPGRGSGCTCPGRVMRSRVGRSPSYNPASRFLDEVPAELVEWRRVEPERLRRRSAGSAFGAVARHRRRPGRPGGPASARWTPALSWRWATG